MSKAPRLRCLKPALHQQAPTRLLWRTDDVRGTPAERGYGHAWRKLRAIILERDEGLCQECRRAGRVTVATQVDHIKPKAIGGTDDPANLAAICKPCHDEKSRREMRDPFGGAD